MRVSGKPTRLGLAMAAATAVFVVGAVAVGGGPAPLIEASASAPRAAAQTIARKNAGLSAFDVRYENTTTPAAIVPGGQVPVTVRLQNVGAEPWASEGSQPVRLSYHWLDGNGAAAVWDGVRATLPFNVQPGDELDLHLQLRAPEAPGSYVVAWDMVEEGVGWFSARAIPMGRVAVVVGDGVTFYGKGWGHGIGLSQWGAQGWAEGAAGPPLTGEAIVAKYFPGAALSVQPESSPFRVLLSAPSTGCVGQTIWDLARVHSAGGMRIVSAADPTVVFLETGPDQPVKLWTDGTNLVVLDEWSGRTAYNWSGAIRVVPKQFWDPIAIDQKDLAYRGSLLVEARDGEALRVVNYVSSDDYMQGTLPGEMPSDWAPEALRAQAITARTYAAWRQATAGDRHWDVRDDTADQCYGGRSFESPRTTAAVASTAGRILTYDGVPIRALFSSSHGGTSDNVGCLLDAKPVGETWQCADGWPYLAVVSDPAELAAHDARGGNPNDQLWSRHFSGDEIKDQIKEDYGVDIGLFVSMEFNLSPGGRPISVRVRGDGAIVDLKGDPFLRWTLGLRSTLVRVTPF
jgi:SpoIID/LytB domain protein